MSADEYEKGKQRLLMATFLQFTLPGIPSIFYGDEVGLQGFRDPYCRMGYPYGNEDNEILDFYMQLGNIRTKFKSDFIAPFKHNCFYNGLYSFGRGDLICAINAGNEDNFINLDDKFVIFNYGNIDTNENQLVMKPKSMVILR